MSTEQPMAERKLFGTDSMVPVYFIRDHSEVIKQDLLPIIANKPLLLSVVAEQFKRFPNEQVVAYVGRSAADGGMAQLPYDWPMNPIDQS